MSWTKAHQAGITKVRKLVMSHSREVSKKHRPDMKYIDKLGENRLMRNKLAKQLAYFKKEPNKVSILNDKEVLHSD